jgi:hypothetical protein
MKELAFGTQGFFDAIVDARERRIETRIVVRGRRASRLFSLVLLFENYRKQASSGSPGRRRALIKFGLRALVRSPSFWSVCVYLGFEAKKVAFHYADDVLNAEFSFSDGQEGYETQTTRLA